MDQRLFLMKANILFVSLGYMLIRCERIMAAVGVFSPGSNTAIFLDALNGMWQSMQLLFISGPRVAVILQMGACAVL